MHVIGTFYKSLIYIRIVLVLDVEDDFPYGDGSITWTEKYKTETFTKGTSKNLPGISVV